ncbi:MAG: ComEC/Rec2 family competence protein [Candidatus Saccharimonas sp.]
MRRVHPTWHFTVLCYGVIAGVVLAQWWQVYWLVALGIGLLCIVLAFWKHRRLLLVLAFLGGACLGLARGAVDVSQIAAYQPLIGSQVVLHGVVQDDIEITPKGTTRMKLADIKIEGRTYPGQVWVTTRDGEQARRSDTVAVQGLLSEGFGNFAASLVGGEVQKIVRPTPGDVALEVRDTFANSVRETVAEPGASLGVGFLLGQKSALPQDLLEALKVAGLTHIVVASGYNLTILVRIGRRLFEKVSKYLSALTGVVLIVGFIAMTGLSPSMTRAGIVTGFGLWAWYFGRKFHPITLLGLAAMLTILWNPSFAWGDIGWLLSFGAFAGVMIIGPLMQAYFFGHTKPPLALQILVETTAATIATVPIIIAVFGTFSNVALLANLLLLPFIPFTMLLTALAGIGGMIGVAWLGAGANYVLEVMVMVVHWCANVPWAQSDVVWAWWGIMLYVVVVIAGCIYMKWRTGYNLRSANIVE